MIRNCHGRRKRKGLASHGWFAIAPLPARSGARLGDSLAVELPALTRAALVRIQVPQPPLSPRCPLARDPQQDPWRERLETGLPGRRPRRRTGGSAWGAVLIVVAAVLGGLALFPLVAEGTTSACAALDAIVGRQAGHRGAAALPAIEPGWPEWLRCHVAYWRWR